jgi:hypothetical protein
VEMEEQGGGGGRWRSPGGGGRGGSSWGSPRFQQDNYKNFSPRYSGGGGRWRSPSPYHHHHQGNNSFRQQRSPYPPSPGGPFSTSTPIHYNQRPRFHRGRGGHFVSHGLKTIYSACIMSLLMTLTVHFNVKIDFDFIFDRISLVVVPRTQLMPG